MSWQTWLSPHLISQAFDKGVDSDVAIALGDTILNLHKIILRRARYFEEKFNSPDFIRSVTLPINDPQLLSIRGFKIALKLLYCDSLTTRSTLKDINDFSLLLEILTCCHYLQFTCLNIMQMIEEKIAHAINDDNFFIVVILCQNIETQLLKDLTKKYAIYLVERILASQDYIGHLNNEVINLLSIKEWAEFFSVENLKYCYCVEEDIKLEVIKMIIINHKQLNTDLLNSNSTEIDEKMEILNDLERTKIITNLLSSVQWLLIKNLKAVIKEPVVQIPFVLDQIEAAIKMNYSNSRPFHVIVSANFLNSDFVHFCREVQNTQREPAISSDQFIISSSTYSLKLRKSHKYIVDSDDKIFTDEIDFILCLEKGENLLATLVNPSDPMSVSSTCLIIEPLQSPIHKLDQVHNTITEWFSNRLIDMKENYWTNPTNRIVVGGSCYYNPAKYPDEFKIDYFTEYDPNSPPRIMLEILILPPDNIQTSNMDYIRPDYMNNNNNDDYGRSSQKMEEKFEKIIL